MAPVRLRLPRRSLLAALGLLAAASSPGRADEGFWTFDNFPTTAVRAAHGWAPGAGWLERVRLGTPRLTAAGCSSALLSARGLLMTNQHCVIDCLEALSAPGENLVELGFSAALAVDERRCPGLSADIVTDIEDVTGRVLDAAGVAETSGFTDRRDAEIARIEAGCARPPQVRCQVVSLYRGGRYGLYRYRSYDDIRMSFAPELAAAFFGGDPDNYNFPRYGFDVAFLRIYEDGRPAPTPRHLRWSPRQPSENELVFLAGTPGTTSRQAPQAQLEYLRDLLLPWRLVTSSEWRGRLLAYSAQGAEPARIVAEQLFGTENQFKRMTGQIAALRGPLMATKAGEEQALRARIAADPALAAQVGDAYGEIDRAFAALAPRFHLYMFAEGRVGWGSELFAYARHIVRNAAENRRPDAERLPEYSQARRESTAAALLSDSRPEPAMEEMLLSFWLSKAREYLTVDHPFLAALLERESPEVLARRLVLETRLIDPEERRRLWNGGAAAVDSSDDPLIALARRIDAPARAVRAEVNQLVEGPVIVAQERLSRARFALLGRNVYPDATFTLRLSYGRVRGWTEPGGRVVAPFTRTSGLRARATGHEPYALAPRWVAAMDRMSPDTLFNFVTDNDSVGGSSGSPLIDRGGNVIGLVHDGNIHSLAGEYGYDADLNRAIMVSGAIIEEALVKVYRQHRLVRELRGGAAR